MAVPRPPLPTVRVTLGEPGYISTRNSAIELKATSGNAAFDGHIGYHFEVDGKRTIDIPVVARAVLKPHQEWSFATWMQLREPSWQERDSLNRELVIEWRDRSMSLVAQKVVGRPPWSTVTALRVVGDGEAAGECCFGKRAYVRRAADLPAVAQWYSGFSYFVIATERWLDLPLPVREAAFSAGTPRVFIGAPRAGQTLTALDRAVLPVAFADGGSWRAKKGATSTGSPSSRDLVTDEWNVFARDASALAADLPVTKRFNKRPYGRWRPVADVRASELVRRNAVVIIALLVLLVTVVIALMLVRSRRIVAIAATLVAVAALLACRDQLRLRADTHIYDEWRPEGLDATRHLTTIREYGPTPIAGHPTSADDVRLSVTRAGDDRQEAEVRDANTAPGYGAMFVRGSLAWDSTARRARRSEVGTPIRITIRRRDHQSMTFDYEAPFPVQFARASWTWNGMTQYGDGRLTGGKHGQATVHNMRFVSSLQGELQEFWNWGDTTIALAGIGEKRTSVVFWNDVSDRDGAAQWSMSGQLRRGADGIARCSFGIRPFSPDATVWVEPQGMGKIPEMTVTYAGNSVPLASDETVKAGRRKLDAAIVRRIATEGGVLSIAVEADADDSLPGVEIVVKENRQ